MHHMMNKKIRVHPTLGDPDYPEDAAGQYVTAAAGYAPTAGSKGLAPKAGLGNDAGSGKLVNEGDQDDADRTTWPAPNPSDFKKKVKGAEKPRPIASFLQIVRSTGLMRFLVIGNTFMQMRKMIGTRNAKEVAKSTWTTMGVVSALLASVSLTPIFSAQGTAMSITSQPGAAGTVPGSLWAVDPWSRSLLYISVLSFLCNITVILMSVLLFILIDHCFTKDGVDRFLKDWILIINFLPVIFGIACLLNALAVLICVAIATGIDKDFFAILAICAFIIVALLTLACEMLLYVGVRCADATLMLEEEEAKRSKGEGAVQESPAAAAAGGN